MAVRTAKRTKNRAYDELQSVSKQINAKAKSNKTLMASGTFNADHLVALRADCLYVADVILQANSVPGLAAYIQEAENDVAYDPIAAYVALRTACLATVTTIETLAPDGSGFLELYTFTPGQSALTPRVFTAGQTVPLQANMDSIDSAVEDI